MPTRGGEGAVTLATAVPAAFAEATVIVVDDNPSNVLLVERLLRTAGVSNVHSFTDARLVVDRCVELQPDLLLLDLHMPHLDGYAVLAALHRALPADTFLPVLVLTADATARARERALDAGAKDFLTKPLDPIETVQRVRNLLETRQLYRTVQQHNEQLQAELDERTEQDRRRADDLDVRRARVEQVLRAAPLPMVFQPIVDLRTGAVAGVEALARIPDEPLRAPNEWFEEAGTVDLQVELELAAIQAAVAQMRELRPNAFMSVNASPATATRPQLASILAVHGSRIVLELTEQERVDDYPTLIAALDDLRALGVRIAVDDAGAGYAGLQHLLRLRPEIIKLDLELTRDLHNDPARRALAAALVMFAGEIDALIVAEGIECAGELHALRTLGVPWGQGFLLAKPGPLPVSAEVPGWAHGDQAADAPGHVARR
ncbi:MAG: hypothetical protein JWN46_3813 [Acidimicrobiales bacterium]|nr:hypothetical protein [Acidimicrobiales bacterium]